jgi:hypothetical protein
MMLLKNRKVRVVMWILLSVFASQCVDSDTAMVKIYLTDAPAAYDAVNVDIQSITIKTNAKDVEESIVLERAGVYNLLDFTGGLDTLLGTIDLPEGKISQIRLVLGSNNSLVINGETIELKVPSGSESGLKLLVNEQISGGVTYKYVLDFDASRSVVAQGNGKYSLKPVIRMFTDATSGAIGGKVEPPIAEPFVWAVSGTDTLGTIANSKGEFLIRGVPEGSYNLTLLPQNGGVQKNVNNVSVFNGKTTNVGTVEMN